MKFIIGLILSFSLIGNVYADKISAPPPLSKEYKDISEVLYHYLREMFDNYHVLEVVTTNPDGSRSAKKGAMILLQTGGKHYLEINTDGVKEWRGVELTDVP